MSLLPEDMVNKTPYPDNKCGDGENQRNNVNGDNSFPSASSSFSFFCKKNPEPSPRSSLKLNAVENTVSPGESSLVAKQEIDDVDMLSPLPRKLTVPPLPPRSSAPLLPPLLKKLVLKEPVSTCIKKQEKRENNVLTIPPLPENVVLKPISEIIKKQKKGIIMEEALMVSDDLGEIILKKSDGNIIFSRK